MPLREYYRRHLPHYHPAGATYHIVFRLAGSLPASVLVELRKGLWEHKWPCPTAAQADAPDVLLAAQRRYFAKLERNLDAAPQGPRWLEDAQVADIVYRAMRERDTEVYALSAFTIMPNHVHLVCTLLPDADGVYPDLTKLLASLKGYTAWRANAILGRRGAFWQGESFDRVVRDLAEFRRTIAYVANNPVRAGLAGCPEDWRWTYVAPGLGA